MLLSPAIGKWTKAVLPAAETRMIDPGDRPRPCAPGYRCRTAGRLLPVLWPAHAARFLWRRQDRSSVLPIRHGADRRCVTVHGAAAPGHDLACDLVWCALRAIDHVHGLSAVGRVDVREALPAHRLPCVRAQNVRHVPRVLGMGAHPGRTSKHDGGRRAGDRRRVARAGRPVSRRRRPVDRRRSRRVCRPRAQRLPRRPRLDPQRAGDADRRVGARPLVARRPLWRAGATRSLGRAGSWQGGLAPHTRSEGRAVRSADVWSILPAPLAWRPSRARTS